MHRSCRLAVAVAQRLYVDIHYRALTSFLTVVYVSYCWYQVVHSHLVGQTVLAMEMYGGGVVFAEYSECVHNRVFVAEESYHTSALLIGYVGKAVCCHLLIFLYQSLCHHKFLNSVLAGILKHLLASEF